MAAKLTDADVQKIVVDVGNPERLIVDADDWQEIHSVYQRYNSDVEGVFIEVLGTRIYSTRPMKASLVNSPIIKNIIAGNEETGK